MAKYGRHDNFDSRYQPWNSVLHRIFFLKNFKRARALIKETGDSVTMAYILADMAAIYLLRQDYDPALELYRQALLDLNDPNGYIAAFIRNDIGSALCQKRQYKKALGYFLPSLHYYLLTNDKLGRTNTTFDLANAYEGLEQTDKAIAYALESFSQLWQALKIC